MGDCSGAKGRYGWRNTGSRSDFQSIVLEATYAFPETRENIALHRAQHYQNGAWAQTLAWLRPWASALALVLGGWHRKSVSRMPAIDRLLPSDFHLITTHCSPLHQRVCVPHLLLSPVPRKWSSPSLLFFLHFLQEGKKTPLPYSSSSQM